MRTHDKVSLTTSESETEVSRSALPMSAVRPSETKVNLTAPASKKPPFTGGFLMAIRRQLMRTHDKVSLTTSESETEVSRSALPMSAVRPSETKVNLTAII